MIRIGHTSDPIRRATILAACAAASAALGCRQIATLMAVGAGGDETAAEFKLVDGPVALVVDDPDQLGVLPEAISALYEHLLKDFTEKKVNCRLINPAEVAQLQQTQPDFETWSIRRIGERLGAEQVIHLRVQYWATRAAPTDPHFQGRWRAAIKVISTANQPDVRLWPTDGSDRTADVKTDPELTDEAAAELRIARELGEKMARAVGRYFYAYKPLEEGR